MNSYVRNYDWLDSGRTIFPLIRRQLNESATQIENTNPHSSSTSDFIDLCEDSNNLTFTVVLGQIPRSQPKDRFFY